MTLQEQIEKQEINIQDSYLILINEEKQIEEWDSMIEQLTKSRNELVEICCNRQHSIDCEESILDDMYFTRAREFNANK